MIKEKILAAIKAKFPKVNLSKARLEQIASRIEKTVIDDETKIDAALDEFDSFNPLVEIAKNDDKIRDLAAKAKIAGKPETVQPNKPAEQVNNPDAPEVIPDDVPAWAKTLIEQNQKLTQVVGALQTDKLQGTMKEKAAAALKDIPASFWNNWTLPETEDGLEAFTESVKTGYESFTKEAVERGLNIIPGPGGAGGNTQTKDSKVDPSVKAFAEKLKSQQQQQTSPTA